MFILLHNYIISILFISKIAHIFYNKIFTSITDNERGCFAQKYLPEMRVQTGYVLRVSGELYDNGHGVKKLCG